MRLTRIKGKRVPGFTLVEMAIVLVIIGIILAGIMKGRDIVRGSQVKQFSQGFAQKWVTIAATYYDKVGQQLYDGVPNGSTLMPTVDGRMDTGAPTGDTARSFLLNALRKVGITPCTLIKSDLEDWTNPGTTPTTGDCGGYNIYERMVEGEHTGKSRVQVGFANIQIGAGGPIRNVVFFENVPADVAIGLDTLVDGQADGQNGVCQLVETFATEQAAGSSILAPAGPGTTPVVDPLAYPASTGDQFLVIVLVLDY